MASNPPLILRLLATSSTAAKRAGNIIRDIMSKGELGIVEKDKNDLQTEADRSAQKCIIGSLSHHFPHLKIIGEEEQNNCEVPSDWIVMDSDQEILTIECPSEYVEVSNEDVVVWVDPLDGTSEYTQGLLDHVTVLVGIAVKGKAVAGVIHQPYYNYLSNDKTLGRTIWGLVGYGVGGFEPNDPPAGGLTVVTTRSHSNETVQKALEALKPDNIVRVGGAGHKVLLLAEGKAHAYVFASKGCKKWDTCAPEAVLSAVGGKLTDMHGNMYSYQKDVEHPNKGGVLATARGVDYNYLASKIPEDVKNMLV